MSVGPRSEKFNIVSNDHGRTQKCDFCVSVCKTNFTDHHTPDTKYVFRDSVLFCKIHDCYCTIRKDIESISIRTFPFVPIKKCERLQWLDYIMKTNHFRVLLNVCSTTYTYSNCIVYRLFYF